MLDNIKIKTISMLSVIQIQNEINTNNIYRNLVNKLQDLNYMHDTTGLTSNLNNQLKIKTIINSKTKIERNSLCLCGSNKKYKQCHGKAW